MYYWIKQLDLGPYLANNWYFEQYIKTVRSDDMPILLK